VNVTSARTGVTSITLRPAFFAAIGAVVVTLTFVDFGGMSIRTDSRPVKRKISQEKPIHGSKNRCPYQDAERAGTREYRYGHLISSSAAHL
jgi:hypothetical protein